MFSLFKRKLPLQPTVTPADKKWIEDSFDWFIKAFSLTKVKGHPFILPGEETVACGKLTNPDQLQMLVDKLCKHWKIDTKSVVIKIFDDLYSKQWNTPFVPTGEHKGPVGMYEQLFEGNNKIFQISIAQSNLNYPDVALTILTHELAHAKLLGGEYVNQQEQNMEPLTDLTCIYFGFGVFLANTCMNQQGNWLSRLGYLPNEVISYANALLCYITDYDPSAVTAHLNTNTRELFEQDYKYLTTTNNTYLSKAHIQQSDQIFLAYEKINNGWNEKNFDIIIETSNSLLGKAGNDAVLLNGIGYAFLGKKQYHFAIEAFTKAIDKSPFWDYPYNNRGYCRLQLGEVDAAYPDLHSSWEMNQGNSFNWRNLGVYFLLKSDHPKALEYLEQAEKIDPNTEMINFYLGLVHQRSGNKAKASQYFHKSKAQAEFNDSIFSENDQL